MRRGKSRPREKQERPPERPQGRLRLYSMGPALWGKQGGGKRGHLCVILFDGGTGIKKYPSAFYQGERKLRKVPGKGNGA